MAVGTETLEIYEGEDVTIVFDIDSGPADVTGFTFAWLVKASATATGAALLTGTCNVTGAQQVTVTVDADLVGGSYTYGLRRTDAASETQYAQGTLTVVSSVNVAH
jgi:hypothetical protein